MAVPSDGSYGVPEGLISSFPCTTKDGTWEIVQGLEIDEFSRPRIDASVAELVEERDAVTALGLARLELGGGLRNSWTIRSSPTRTRRPGRRMKYRVSGES